MDIGISRGEIDYVASNRRQSTREASDPPDECLIFSRVDDRNWTRPYTPIPRGRLPLWVMERDKRMSAFPFDTVAKLPLRRLAIRDSFR